MQDEANREREMLLSELRKAAQSASDIDRQMAEAKSLRQPGNPERCTDLYAWQKPENTLYGRALAALTTPSTSSIEVATVERCAEAAYVWAKHWKGWQDDGKAADELRAAIRALTPDHIADAGDAISREATARQIEGTKIAPGITAERFRDFIAFAIRNDRAVPALPPTAQNADYQRGWAGGHRAAALRLEAAQPGMVLVPRERLDQFVEAVHGLRWVAERLMGGQQFNAYDSATNEDDDPDEDCEMVLALGPISDARWLGQVTGRDQAKIIEAALKFATVAMLAAAPVAGQGEVA